MLWMGIEIIHARRRLRTVAMAKLAEIEEIEGLRMSIPYVQ
jgi:hypothetical protein